MTQRQAALKNNITPEMRFVAKEEGVLEFLLEKIAQGKVALLKNKNRKINPVGIGEGLSVKINANMGTSPFHCDLELEKGKIDLCHQYKAHAVMDLSVGGDIDANRKMVLDYAQIPVGTVPAYQNYEEIIKQKRELVDLKPQDVLSVIEKQAKDGVDFMTIHSGLTKKGVEYAKKRVMGIVSRGGALMAEWMTKTGKENLLFTLYDEILDILKAYDVTISLGDGLRPGCIEDATDAAQIYELMILGDLTQRAWDKGVQVMVEGPGHVPFDQIEANIKLQKQLCKGAPFYVLGPLVTDIAPGYDHIAGAIGGTLAAVAGADFLCYLTPAEHLSLPDLNDVKEGIIASHIAAHAANLVRGIKKSWQKDQAMALARKNLDWEGMFAAALDPEKAKAYRKKSMVENERECSMCGQFCSVKRMIDHI